MPATIVEDAKRHHLVVAPIDVAVSSWDCTLEPSQQSTGGFAVRMGLRYVKGLRERDWEIIDGARRQVPFVSLEDFVQRSELEEGVLSTLAEAGAFEGFAIDRRSALWDIRRLSHTRDEPLSLNNRKRSPHFDLLTDFEEVKWDYRTTSHSPRRHPLEPMPKNKVARIREIKKLSNKLRKWDPVAGIANRCTNIDNLQSIPI